ncbi:hypothetical protein PUR49_08105 [Streptomyces sp. BE147]|uniref:hypothetical protein n=1 Tax=Streptomyces sp. BE147 TaxID=3002524 RepID=UPI002E7AAE01|nr:hypothetical protein [Streptomyces sp. BE147]MEE1736461.1 hypothetical protein [Streptomyces sp. BE147]
MSTPDALCGAPHAVYFGPFLKLHELEWDEPQPAAILRIVAAYVTESNIDANDLAARLEAAGFPLPELPEGALL